MKRTKIFLPLVLLILLINSSTPAPVAEAQIIPVPVANIFVGLIRSVSALNNRNRIYREADKTVDELNAYYDGLISRMKPSEMGTQYWRLRSQLEAERQAMIKAAETFKQDARNRFRNDMNHVLVDQLAGSKGGTRLLGQVRETLVNTQLAAVKVAEAANEGQPLRNLVAELNSNLERFPGLQEQIVKLGGALGDKLNHALGGLPNRVDEAAVDLQSEMVAAVEEIDKLDSFIVKVIEDSRSPVSPITASDGGRIGFIGDDGLMQVMNNTIDNVIGLLGVFDAAGKPPEYAGQIQEIIRNAILAGQLQSLDQASANATFADCEIVTREEYVAAAGQLGATPETALDEERVIYKICRDRETEEIIYAYMIGPVATVAEGPGSEDAGEQESSAESSPALPDIDISACLVPAGAYTYEAINISDQQAKGSQARRSCNADGQLTNHSGQDLLFAVFRVNNYGGHSYEKWMLNGYTILEAGETRTDRWFYRCTGGPCDDGEWYYIDRISILYYTPECAQLAWQYEDKIPESIIEIENPCDW